MRVIVFGKATKETEAGAMPTQQMWSDMEKYTEELIQAGILVGGEGLKPSSTGVRIRFANKQHLVTEGPFVETKEIIAGYSIWQVKSMEEAVAWAKRCPMAEESEMEIREIFCYSADEVDEICSNGA